MATADEKSYSGPERRTATRIELTEEQLDHIVDKVYERLYAAIGRNVVKQALLLLGAIGGGIYLLGKAGIHKIFGG